MAIDKGKKVSAPVQEDEYVDEQAGSFPPFWTPEEGASFIAKLVAVDQRDPKFMRLIWEAIEPVPCQLGADREDILVGPGDRFTTSTWSALMTALTPIDAFEGIPAKVVVTGSNTSKSSGNNFYTFSVKTSSKFRDQLTARKKEIAATQLPANGSR